MIGGITVEGRWTISGGHMHPTPIPFYVPAFPRPLYLPSDNT